MAQQWVWEIPWAALEDAQSGTAFRVEATVYVDTNVEVHATFNVNVPPPFDEFSIPAPTLTDATPSTVTDGTAFADGEVATTQGRSVGVLGLRRRFRFLLGIGECVEADRRYRLSGLHERPTLTTRAFSCRLLRLLHFALPFEYGHARSSCHSQHLCRWQRSLSSET